MEGARYARADALAAGLRQIEGIGVEEPDTNLVYFDPAGAGVGAEALQAGLRAEGIAVSALGGRLRACTHLDVSASMIPETLDAIRRLLRP